MSDTSRPPSRRRLPAVPRAVRPAVSRAASSRTASAAVLAVLVGLTAACGAGTGAGTETSPAAAGASTAVPASAGPSAASTPTAGTPAAGTAPPVTSPGPADPPAEPDVQRLSITVADGEATGDTGTVPVALGRPVEITVTSDVADEVHVHGVDLTEAVPAGGSVVLRFVQEAPGRFEVELHDSRLLLTRLQVS